MSPDTALHRIAIVFRDPPREIEAGVAHGRLVEPAPAAGAQAIAVHSDRVLLGIGQAQVGVGANATRVSIHLRASADAQGVPGFSFFLRDVTATSPILIRSLGVAILPAEDPRTYAQVDAEILARGQLSEAQRISSSPEETYAEACRHTRDQKCPTWLGLSRDVRIFRVSANHWSGGGMGYWGQVEPFNHSEPRERVEGRGHTIYTFVLGRGARASVEIERRLEEGPLPILHSVQRDGEVEYHLTLFATLEGQPLRPDVVRGTHPVAALANTWGAMLTPEELSLYNDTLRPAEILKPEQELVCWVHIEAVNTGRVPRYAYVQGPGETLLASRYDPATGYTCREDGRVLALSTCQGRPMPQKEMALLLQPGTKTSFDLCFFHAPVSPERAEAFSHQRFEDHHDACRAYWQAKLGRATQISVPEPAIHERIAAGLLHLDLAILGQAKEGPLLATVGWYSPIGSESSPIIQYLDSIGWHDVAERCIDFFLVRQRPDGFIQTFGGYQLETGPVLWTIGEHFRYTRDAAWARRIQDRVFKACDYILAWRRRNQREELRGRGYGLLDGKVADPEDFFHSFMLNALACLGLKRIAETYREIAPEAARSLAEEAKAFLADIRTAYAQNVAQSPVIPLGDGTWIPSFGPWSEYPGPVSLFAEGGHWFSHGTFACRDTLIGSLYLGIGEILDPREPLAAWLLQAHQELMTYRNAGFSQPYYCRHDWLHLKRGEVAQYLKTFYNQLAALQDRETYTSWEHYYGVSQHKTHEEGWFLMQTRWMLWDEDYEASRLRLLSMIPRAWLAQGQPLRLQHCVSYFGRFSLSVEPDPAHNTLSATITFHDPQRRPATLLLRLPHPQRRCPCEVSCGTYDPESESVRIESPGESTTLTLRY